MASSSVLLPSALGLLLLGGLVLPAGCGWGAAQGDDCAAIDDAAAREDCRVARLDGLTLEAAAAEIAAVPDAASRDLLRVRMVVRDPLRYGPLCADVRHRGSRDWCEDVVERIHLVEPGGR